MAGIIIFGAFCVFFRLRFKLAADIDILDLKGSLCVTFFRLKTICFDIAVEKGFFVIYDKRGVPVYFPIALPKPMRDEIAESLSFPIIKKLHFKSLCMTTEIGAAGNAAATATALTFSRVAYDVVFSVMSHKGRGMRICRELRPVYDKNSIKTELSSIFAVSLANIIIYAVLLFLKAIKRMARKKGV